MTEVQSSTQNCRACSEIIFCMPGTIGDLFWLLSCIVQTTALLLSRMTKSTIPLDSNPHFIQHGIFLLLQICAIVTRVQTRVPAIPMAQVSSVHVLTAGLDRRVNQVAALTTGDWVQPCFKHQPSDSHRTKGKTIDMSKNEANARNFRAFSGISRPFYGPGHSVFSYDSTWILLEQQSQHMFKFNRYFASIVVLHTANRCAISKVLNKFSALHIILLTCGRPIEKHRFNGEKQFTWRFKR